MTYRGVTNMSFFQLRSEFFQFAESECFSSHLVLFTTSNTFALQKNDSSTRYFKGSRWTWHRFMSHLNEYFRWSSCDGKSVGKAPSPIFSYTEKRKKIDCLLIVGSLISVMTSMQGLAPSIVTCFAQKVWHFLSEVSLMQRQIMVK